MSGAFQPTEILRLLVAAIRQINARYRDPAGRRVLPDISKLAQIKVNLLVTDLGPLDLLRVIGDGLNFDALVERSVDYELTGERFSVIDVETLIETKELAGRPKDLYALPFLRALLTVRDDPS